MYNNLPEILAPAGSMESLVSALRSGADAVYVGGKAFSARNNASNFSCEELREASELCHLYGAKLYLAVNTIVSDEEINDFCTYIKDTAKAGIDAFIVQDHGCAKLIRRCVPDAVLHASTQMSVHTAEGARFLKELGFSRVVPARELNKNTIKSICDTGIETEVFLHGALCMSVSGQCYMSAMIGSRSANRGVCAQACRLPFSACGNKEHCALSLKDLSLLPVISELKNTGVCSLKIEGRMKRPEYVASAVDSARKALDGQKPDMDTLRSIFSRGGFTDGYFSGKRTGMFGVREKNDIINGQALMPKIHELYRFERKKRVIDFSVQVKYNQPLRITACCGNAFAEMISDCPEKAEKRPVDKAYLEKQLSRLGDTVFAMGELSADIDDGLAVPAGKLNEIRRTLTAEISEQIIALETTDYTITDYSPHYEYNIPRADSPLKIRAFCRTAEQAKASLELSEFVILDSNISLSEPLLSANPELYAEPDKIILSPPRFICDEDKLIDSLRIIKEKFGFSRLLCHTPDAVAIGKKLGFTLHGGFGLNVFNSYSAEAVADYGLADFTVSFEARLSQINQLHSPVPYGAVIYGKLPLMLTRNCPIKNEIGCKNCTGSLTDRTGRSFDVVCYPDYTEILNSDVLFLTDKLSQFSSASFGIVMLSDEDASQTIDALRGVKPSFNITRGLCFRGI